MRFNFHSHTLRCGHAVGTERQYVEAAIASDYTALGFSDHSPWPGIHSPRMRMDLVQLPDYLRVVRELGNEYGGRIDIHVGLECEYYPALSGWLRETKQANNLEYLILGNHFELKEGGFYFGLSSIKSDVMRYARTTLKGMETGLYDWVAHPDLYLRDYPEYDDTCRDAARQICRAAKALKMPLEYNLLGLRAITEGRFIGLGYPHRAFWETAAEEGCHVIMSIDAHTPMHLGDTTYYDMGLENIRALGLTLIEGLPHREPQAVNCAQR
ncbi:MAG: histidinol-phosphatase [Eubacteriales bacterium]|nr:histidinol-phosphatase [Eubacteriales bacterium]MDD4105793.1 histidinol-phosphatase [Eubacteriales bacterium]MDD4711040.1 histidinol-phosphatase [Eubacteriales bacterium]NLO16482.1 histidinol-phosphatase [Clostridiales bacterium]